MVAAYAPVANDPIMAYTADEWRQMAARSSLRSFTARMFPCYQEAPHHRLVAEHLEAAARGDIDRLIAVMPPRFGKSTLCSEYFPAWFVGNNPDQRIIGCSHTAQLAYYFSNRVRAIVNHPKWPFPNVRLGKNEAAKSVWGIEGRRGGYVAAGVGGAITGFGANVLLIDDAVKSAADADSETFRESAWEWFTGTALTRLEPNAAVIVIGTRWHDDDLIGRILDGPDSERWTVLHVPALSDGESVYANVTLPTDRATRLGIAPGDEFQIGDVRSLTGAG